MLNKIDLLDAAARRRLANRFPEALQVSAATGEGLDELRATDRRAASPSASRRCACSCRTARAARSRDLYALGAPIDERADTDDGVFVRARLPQRDLRRFARYLVAVVGLVSGR